MFMEIWYLMMIKVYDSNYRGDCPLEDTDQINLTSWFDFNFPHYSRLYFHVVNENMLPVQGRVKAKKKGMRAGVSDSFIMVKRGKYSGLVIELKRRDKRKSKLSADQDDFLFEMSEQGFYCAVCYGFEQAKKCVLEYLTIKQ